MKSSKRYWTRYLSMAKRDWCTFFPEKLFGVPLWPCCKDHDEEYERNGFYHKVIADLKLLHCVARKGYYTMTPVAILMYAAVSTFGILNWGKFHFKKHVLRRG